MISTIKRIDNYLKLYTFQSNNIDFRIVSSKAIEQFKNVQSFQLSQLVNGKFFFSTRRREILLLEYDLYTKWLFEIENLIIESGFIDLDIILELAEKTQLIMNTVMINNNEYFDSKFTNIWKDIHCNILDSMSYMIKEINTSDINLFFTQLVNLVITTMNHTLIEIHELNSIMINNDINDEDYIEDRDCKNEYPIIPKLNIVPTMYITEFSIDVFKHFKISSLLKRLMIYKKFFNIDKITLNNFSNRKLDVESLDLIESVVIVDYKHSIH